ncbi:MAG: hypothetical protein Q8K58_00390 [Acidimicrobiales bacterium]|nr:hypothetical protein [Acidimicrobiales bacterium]
MRRPLRAGVASAVVLLGVWVATSAATAQDAAVSGPTITLDRTSMRPGERVLVTLEGFEGNAVTLAVCGNQARRGSVDCNLIASEGVRLDRDGSSTLAEYPVAAPALPCPCLVRASTKSFDQLAVVPVELLGHPVGPVVGTSAQAPLEVSVRAERDPHGLLAGLRSALGGPTHYDVEVTVRNRSAERLDGIVLAGSVGRGGEGDVTAVEVPTPGSLDPGQTWEGTVRTRLPAPVLGGFTWSVIASGAGGPVEASLQTQARPLGFVLLALVLLADVAAIAWRRAHRHRVRRSAPAAPTPVPA